MSKDKRKKGCPNTICEMHENKVKQKKENDYCPKCGAKLIYVCSKCFKEIQDIDTNHHICKKCEIEKEEKVAKRKEAVKKCSVPVIAVVTSLGTAAADSFKKEGKNHMKKLGSDFGKKVAKKVFKISK